MEIKKITIKILDYKDTSASRTTFETNLGKMSAFKNEGSTLIEDLKNHTNCLISIDMSESVKDGTTYKNIRAFNGKVVEQKQAEPNGVEVISPKKFTGPVIKHDLFNERDKDTSFYTAYAKDVFIALIEKVEKTGIDDGNIVMNQAIQLVKQARDAFSQ